MNMLTTSMKFAYEEELGVGLISGYVVESIKLRNGKSMGHLVGLPSPIEDRDSNFDGLPVFPGCEAITL
ncbi:hypothetical protein RHMOL_Rhmol07G0005100 [Rhododendron molle]|uniref:Uncharacterized protein n=1 Tax=Rhododendron molle TaxID=49168 RepID=A0ACC0MXC7_RHOML|nr:hypothetical protein RHMOL_Rhmol07G0005100 [Rhododendron molle]